MMEKLNELVELAKKADREVTWSLLPFDLAKEGWCVEVVDYIAAMNPHGILAIAEAFRALRERAEAAEVEAKHQLSVNILLVSEHHQRLVAEHNSLRAKLAELEKQEPVPDGWKIVPAEPADKMVIDGFESAPDAFWSTPEEWEKYQAMSGCEQAAHRAKLCYAAMLAAAPSPYDSL